MTLTEQEINAILAEVQYKPGSRFYTERWAYGAGLQTADYPLILCLEVRVPDAQTKKETVLTFKRPLLLGEFADVGDVLRQCQISCHQWEAHEADEWLTFLGDKPFDPHRGEQTALMRRQLSNLDQLVAEMQHYSMLTMDRRHQAQQVALNLADDDLAKRPPVRPQTQGFLDELKDSLSRNGRGHQ